MISSEEWWKGLINYNEKLFPLQLIVMVVGVFLALVILVKPSRISNSLMKAYLGASMIFNGVMFFMVLGDRLPEPLKYIQGSLFIIIGVLLIIDIFKNWTVIKFPTKGIKRNLSILLLVLVLLYPVVGLLRGHNYTQLIYPGTVPCGSTAFALVMLSSSLPKVNKAAYLLLLVWAIPFAPLIQIPQFKVYEDIIMFLVGVVALILFVAELIPKRNKEKTEIKTKALK